MNFDLKFYDKSVKPNKSFGHFLLLSKTRGYFYCRLKRDGNGDLFFYKIVDGYFDDEHQIKVNERYFDFWAELPDDLDAIAYLKALLVNSADCL